MQIILQIKFLKYAVKMPVYYNIYQKRDLLKNMS